VFLFWWVLCSLLWLRLKVKVLGVMGLFFLGSVMFMSRYVFSVSLCTALSLSSSLSCLRVFMVRIRCSFGKFFFCFESCI